MVKDKDIKQFIRQHKPEVRNNESFLKDVVSQINAMPIPAAMNPARQREDCAITISLLPPDILPIDLFMFK